MPEFSERTKMVLRIVGFIGVVALLGFLLYFFLFRSIPRVVNEPEPPTDVTTGGLQGSNNANPSVGGGTGTPSEATPESPGLQPSPVAQGGSTLTLQLTSSEVIPLAIANGTTVAYYDPRDGKFYTIDKNGNVIPLSDTAFPNAEAITMNPDGSIAAVEFPDGSNIIYNFATASQVTLPSHWEEFGFSTTNQIASKSLGVDPNNRSLVVSSSDGSQAQPIALLGTNADKVTVNWSPNNTIVGFSETGTVQTGFGRAEIYLIGVDGNDAGSLIVEGGNFSALWAPDGKHILYSVAETANDYRASLWYTEVTGTSKAARTRLNVETWVEKCTFTNPTTVLCAVPREGADQSGFDHSIITSPDDVYEINVNTGRKTLIASPATNLQMFNLSVTDDGSTLFFTDNRGRLNSMRLK